MRFQGLAPIKQPEPERADELSLEQHLLNELLPEEYARTCIAWPMNRPNPEVYFWRNKDFITYGTARVFYGTLWIDSVGIVHPETPEPSARVVPKHGWVLTISEQAVTPVTDFAEIIKKLQDQKIRARLGLPLYSPDT